MNLEINRPVVDRLKELIREGSDYDALKPLLIEKQRHSELVATAHLQVAFDETDDENIRRLSITKTAAPETPAPWHEEVASTSPLDGALEMARRGVPQIVLYNETKKAIEKGWPDKATTDENTIRSLDERLPSCSFGSVAKAVLGGFWILELDSTAVLERIKTETGKELIISEEFAVRSREGRGHIYFRQNAASISMGNLSQAYVKNSDWSARVNNEYGVTMGSVHQISKLPYTCISSVEIKEAPDWLIAWCLSQKIQKQKNPSEDIARDERGLIQNGDGRVHGFLLHHAGHLRNRGLGEEAIKAGLYDLVKKNCAGPTDWKKVDAMASSICKYPEGKSGDILLTQAAPASEESATPIVDDPSDNDSRFEMTGETFNTKVYEDISRRFTPYPDPGENDLVSRLAKKLVTGTPIPLAYVREPLKAAVLHAIDGKVIHPAHRTLTMRGNYFSVGESESGKTTGLEYALNAGNLVLTTSLIHPQDLFRYKSEQTFIRSFTPEGTVKRNKDGTVKSGRPGNPSQFLYIKEGNLVANCSDYFGAVFSRLTDLYDQTQAATESMTNGDFEAGTVKASTVMCFTPTDYAATFSGKGSIGGGGLNRWGLVNPPEDHSYDDKDWEPLSDKEIQDAITPLVHKVFELRQHDPVVLLEEDGAAKIRLETKALLKKAGKAGKRLLDYFMREQVAQAAVAVDGRLVMTTQQAAYAKAWALAQLQSRLECWPSDSNNQIETMEHTIREAVCTHFVSETRLKDACHFYRQGSGGWFVFNAARSNAISSGAIKLTGKTRKGTRAYCPGSCSEHPAIDGDDKPKKRN